MSETRSVVRAQHGTRSMYVYHRCRCNDCTEANLQYQLESSERRRRRLLADPTLAPHGRHSTYTNWGCRCEPCTEANKAVCKAYYRRGEVST